MSNVRSYREVRTKFVASIPNPSDASEFGKAYSSILATFRKERPGEDVFDNSISVDADEDEIRLWFEIVNEG